MRKASNVQKLSIAGFVIFCITVVLGFSGHISAKEGKPVKIGVIGPMKTIIGEHAWTGASMAAEEINAAGGLNIKGVKHKIELIKKEDNCMASTIDAVNAMRRMLTIDKVDFAVGGWRSEAVLAQSDVAAENKIIFIDTGGGDPGIIERVSKDYDRLKYIFRTQVNIRIFAQCVFVNSVQAIKYALKTELGITKPKVALLIVKMLAGDAFSRAAKGLLPKMGMEVIGEWRPSPLATDLTAELTAIKASGAHMIFLFLPGPAGVPFSRGYGELQIPVAAGGVNGPGSTKKHWKTTGGMCNYEVSATPIGRAKISSKTIPFYDRFVKRLNDYPMHTGTYTYDGMYVLKEGIERAGTIESDAVVDALEKTDYMGVMGRIVFFGKGHKAPHDYKPGPGYLTWVGNQWRDGKQVVISPNGQIAFGDKRWIGVKYEGTVDCKLPPWMIKYWKKKLNR